jgi:hypothetical protein
VRPKVARAAAKQMLDAMPVAPPPDEPRRSAAKREMDKEVK